MVNLISFVIVVAYELANDGIDDHFFQFSIRWAQIFTDGRMPLECGTGQRLILTNVTYEQQGQYICLASNKINGNVREVKSDPVSLQVVGAPRVRRLDNTSTNHVNLIQFFSRIAIAFFKILINILPSSYEKNEINLASLSRDGKFFFFFFDSNSYIEGHSFNLYACSKRWNQMYITAWINQKNSVDAQIELNATTMMVELKFNRSKCRVEKE